MWSTDIFILNSNEHTLTNVIKRDMLNSTPDVTIVISPEQIQNPHSADRRGQTTPTERKRLRRRKLDIDKTMAKFRHRISELSTEALASYLPDGCWLSTYDVWHCYECRNEDDKPASLHSNAFEIMKVARERGINVLGVCTEHRSHGKLVSETPVDGPRIFVGRHNTFNGKQVHKTLSIMPHDKVYLPVES